MKKWKVRIQYEIAGEGLFYKFIQVMAENKDSAKELALRKLDRQGFMFIPKKIDIR